VKRWKCFSKRESIGSFERRRRERAESISLHLHHPITTME
jgi:hypothetical protein